MPSHVRKGDEVFIRTGEYRGKSGTVVRVDHKAQRVTVNGGGIEGVVRTLKPTRLNPQGGQITVDRSFHMSNVSPAIDGKPSRVRFETKKDGSKVRVAARGGKELSVVFGPSRKKKKA
ncbi:MAG TPA: 50S ribosomal protein L24 [Phycisphaerales bacterium]|nr:50S ribosomal protein L24 [Phycisphaerales bacterium]